jgi:hypothetical protein
MSREAKIFNEKLAEGAGLTAGALIIYGLAKYGTQLMQAGWKVLDGVRATLAEMKVNDPVSYYKIVNAFNASPYQQPAPVPVGFYNPPLPYTRNPFVPKRPKLIEAPARPAKEIAAPKAQAALVEASPAPKQVKQTKRHGTAGRIKEDTKEQLTFYAERRMTGMTDRAAKRATAEHFMRESGRTLKAQLRTIRDAVRDYLGGGRDMGKVQRFLTGLEG